jgi:hypothetical protein
VTDIEEAGPGAHGLVFLGERGVLDRKLKTGETDHPAAGCNVVVIKRSSLESVLSRHKYLDFPRVEP